MVQDKAEKRDRIYTTVNSKDISKRRIIKHHSDEKKTSAADPDPYPTTGLKCCTEQRSRMEKKDAGMRNTVQTLSKWAKIKSFDIMILE